MTSGFCRLLFLFWLLVSSSGLVLAQCPNGKTAFIWVNGVLVPDRTTWEKAVDQLKAKFFASHPNLNSACVEFQAVYNQSSGLLKTLLGKGDINQAIDQIGTEKAIRYSQSLESLKNENDNVVSSVVLSLWRTVNNIGNELLNYASTSAVNYTQVQNDLNDLIKAIKEELAAGNKVKINE